MMTEKRSKPRAVTKVEIQFKEVRSFIKAYILNVSDGGLFIRTDAPLPLDSELTLKIQLPDDDEKMEVFGKVVWTNPKTKNSSFPKGMGIKFTKLTSYQSDKIQGYVEKYRKEIKDHSII